MLRGANGTSLRTASRVSWMPRPKYGSLPGEQFVEDGAEGIDVSGRAERIPVAFNLFGRLIVRPNPARRGF